MDWGKIIEIGLAIVLAIVTAIMGYFTGKSQQAKKDAETEDKMDAGEGKAQQRVKQDVIRVNDGIDKQDQLADEFFKNNPP